MEDETSDRRDLANFLEKVDEIGDLVKGLASSDPQASSQAITRADAYLEKSGRKKEEERGGERSDGVVVQDRTVISRKQDSSAAGIASNKSQFRQALEEDARERAERRKEAERAGKERKRRGNEAFRRERYDSAVEYYTEAIQQMPWDVTLYTNRALAYNRLGRYEEAIGDCNTAIKFEPNTLKAYLQKGKAHTSLQNFKQIKSLVVNKINYMRCRKAEDCYQEACVLFPSEAEQIKGYIQELHDRQMKQL